MLTGARFTGEQALELGIAHSLVADGEELEAQCNAVLEQIENCAPGANAATKRILFEARQRSRGAALDFAAEQFAQCLSGEEAKEGIAAFLEKRPAKWEPTSGADGGD